MANNNNKRIEILDSFRFIAIFGVLLYHYYYRWTPPKMSVSYYPYGSDYNFSFYGHQGVQFFFIISGFVIAYTLQATSSIGAFWKKRMIRLFPPMLICSIITLVFFNLLDTENLFARCHSVPNFFASITFLSPNLINRVLAWFNLDGIGYLCGNYWSLWPELQFYLVASVIYFINKKHFVRNLFVFTIALYIFDFFVGKYFWQFEKTTFNTFFYWFGAVINIQKYLLWFLVGVFFYKIFTKDYSKYTILGLAIASGILFYNCFDWKYRIVLGIMLTLFLLFVYKAHYLSFLNNKIMTTVGLVSYTLYLIHEYIGIFLINKCGAILGHYSFLFPVLVIAMFVAFSYFSYNYLEKPISKYLKTKLL